MVIGNDLKTTWGQVCSSTYEAIKPHTLKTPLSQRAGGVVQWQNSFLAYKRRYKDRKEEKRKGGGLGE